MSKPFVEKPANADDHNIWIYYPRSAGGGCQKLFRKADRNRTLSSPRIPAHPKAVGKVENKSSEFDREQNTVRRDGSYLYEEFLATQGVDLKGYTLGLDYCHVEARKAPVIDGVVERDAAGMEA